jgi:hypothetical protein
MLVSILADGLVLKPVMIIQRSTAELELFEVGHKPEQLLLTY